MDKIRKIFFCFMPLSFVYVVSVLWAQETEGLKDVKPPAVFPFNIFSLFFWFLIIMALLTVVALLFFLKRRTPVEEKIVPVDPPWVIAYRQLDLLKKDRLIEQGQVKVYFTRLSDIVRHYLEKRFGIRAPEMTTEEFLWELRESPVLCARHKEFLKEFLSSCDMVKFARHLSTAAEMEKVLISAKSLIDETKVLENKEPVINVN